MATYSFNTTGSITYFPDNISASQAVTWSITQSHPGTSYFTLETLPNQNGQYDTGSTKSTSGSFTYDSGIVNIVKDDYKMGAVVKQGGGNLYFIPAVPITGSNLRVRGVGGRLSYGTLLDRWPNAAAAYSLRLLNSYYEGPAVRVRRSVDNEETNIGFNPVELDTTALTNFATNAGTALPADYGNGPEIGYSLRYIESTYSGPVIRVRRDSDNSEANFTPSEITDGTLEAWVGVGNNGFVTTWYNQAKDSKHATQSTATKQPKIYDSNTGLVTTNGKPAISFDGSIPTYLLHTWATGSTGATVFETFSTSDTQWILHGNSILYFPIAEPSSAATSEDNAGITQWYKNSVAQSIANRGNVSSVYATGTSLVASYLLTANLSSQNNIALGNMGDFSGGYAFTGTVQESIWYLGNQTSNRTDIESNINNYYNIFPFDAYVTTWYDQSGNGNNAVQSTAANQPQIVSSGSVITENGKAGIQFGYQIGFSATITLSQPISTFSVAQNSNVSGGMVYDRGSTGDRSYLYFNSDWKIYSGLQVGSYNQTQSQSVFSVLHYGSNSYLYVNANQEIQQDAGTQGLNNLSIGTNNYGGAYLDGKIQELILYSSDQSSNRTGIETNINDFYKIY